MFVKRFIGLANSKIGINVLWIKLNYFVEISDSKTKVISLLIGFGSIYISSLVVRFFI